jgi:hypothetical protein
MGTKPTKRSTRKSGKIARSASNLPLPPDQAAGIRGGARTAVNFGDIKGESTDKDHKDWILPH